MFSWPVTSKSTAAGFGGAYSVTTNYLYHHWLHSCFTFIVILNSTDAASARSNFLQHCHKLLDSISVSTNNLSWWCQRCHFNCKYLGNHDLQNKTLSLSGLLSTVTSKIAQYSWHYSVDLILVMPFMALSVLLYCSSLYLMWAWRSFMQFPIFDQIRICFVWLNKFRF